MQNFNQTSRHCSKIKKSHSQMQCCQCVVDCQCFCNVLCSLNSNFIVLWMLNFNKIVNFKISCFKNKQSHLQMQCCQCVVDCQCFCNVLCSFISNFIVLLMLNFNKIVNFKISC